MTSPVANNVLVETLASAIRHGGTALTDVPWVVKRVIREDAWRHYQPRVGSLQKPRGFDEFVTKGLKATEAILRRICAEDKEALDLLDAAYQRPVGGDRRSEDFKGNNVPPERPHGNTAAKALRSLRKNAPEIHARVIAGELSPNAGMIEAGLRKKTISSVPKDPEAAARVLRRHFDAEQLQDLARRLMT